MHHFKWFYKHYKMALSQFWRIGTWIKPGLARASNISTFWFPWTICYCLKTSIHLHADVISKLNQKYQTNSLLNNLTWKFSACNSSQDGSLKREKKNNTTLHGISFNKLQSSFYPHKKTPNHTADLGIPEMRLPFPPKITLTTSRHFINPSAKEIQVRG